MVSQFEALQAEDAVAFSKGLPVASRFKRRESRWPPIEPSQPDSAYKHCETLSNEATSLPVWALKTARFELVPPIPIRLPKGTPLPSCDVEDQTPDSVWAHAAV